MCVVLFKSTTIDNNIFFSKTSSGIYYQLTVYHTFLFRQNVNKQLLLLLFIVLFLGRERAGYTICLKLLSKSRSASCRLGNFFKPKMSLIIIFVFMILVLFIFIFKGTRAGGLAERGDVSGIVLRAGEFRRNLKLCVCILLQ